MEAEKTYDKTAENISEENVCKVDTESLVSDITVTPEIIDDFKLCIFCNERIERDVLFCSYCGKPQNPEAKNPYSEKRKILYKKKQIRKKTSKNAAEMMLKVFSYISFGFSLLAFFVGIYRMIFMNQVTISFFGTSSDSLIVNQTHVVGNLLISIIFLLIGMFLNLKADKNR